MDIVKEIQKKNYYNRDKKINFLSNLNDTEFTIDKKAYSLQKIKTIEEELEKDLSEFDYEEIEYTMQHLEYRHILNLNLALETFTEYTEYMSGEKDNLYLSYKRKNGEDLHKYIVDLKLEKYFSKEKLNSLLEEIETNREKGLILALYEGIRGKHLYEIRTLKIENIDEVNKRIKVTDYDGAERYVSVSNELIDMLYEIDREKSVILKDDKRYRERDFENTPYVFRSAEYLSVVRNIDDEEDIVSNHTINSIFKAIQRTCHDCKYLTPVSLVNSGIYNKILDSYREGLIELSYRDLNILLVEYSFSKSGIYSWVRKVRDLLDRLDNLEEMEKNSLEELLLN